MDQPAEQEIRALGPDYCYVCQKLIRKSQKSLCVGRDSSGEEYRRHSNCAPGSPKWMRSDAAAHPNYQFWTELFQKSKKNRELALLESADYTWEEIHSMDREDLVGILDGEDVPPEDYVGMSNKEIADTLCVMLRIKKRKKEEDEEDE